jgi:hypothetical protein
MRTVLSLTAVAVLYATSAIAQNEMPACDGDITVVRVSQIKPGGSMQGFLAAVAAHKEWYRSHGFKDNEIMASRVLVMDHTTGAIKYSDTEVLTYHFRPPGMGNAPGRGDASWNAYVKLYRENSDIKSEYITCMPKLVK